jgi:hypothetical protein
MISILVYSSFQLVYHVVVLIVVSAIDYNYYYIIITNFIHVPNNFILFNIYVILKILSV